MARVFLVILLTVVFETGCATPVVYPNIKGLAQDDGTLAPADETGRQYCRRLATTTDVLATNRFIGGASFAGAATFLAVMAAAMGPGEDGKDWHVRNRNLLTLGGAAILAIPATLFLSRAMDFSTASGAASRAQASNAEDDKIMAACLRSRAIALDTRAALAASTLQQFQEDRAGDKKVLQALHKLALQEALAGNVDSASSITTEALSIAKSKGLEVETHRLKQLAKEYKLMAPKKAPEAQLVPNSIPEPANGEKR